MQIQESELVLNTDGSIYHLNLHPEELADTILLVGDPDRVPKVSKHFDSVEVKKQKREIVSHTGYVGKKRLTVMSTGMGTGGVDIIINEADALANIDLKTRQPKSQHKTLEFIRMGTSGSFQKDVPVDSLVVAARGIGFDHLAGFYDVQYNATEQNLMNEIIEKFNHHPSILPIYVADADPELVNLLGKDNIVGNTASSASFYGGQGRVLRAPLRIKNFIETISQCNITNFEMESGPLCVVAKLLGHKATSINAVVANRQTNQFTRNMYDTVDKMIQYTLEKLSTVPELVS